MGAAASLDHDQPTLESAYEETTATAGAAEIAHDTISANIDSKVHVQQTSSGWRVDITSCCDRPPQKLLLTTCKQLGWQACSSGRACRATDDCNITQIAKGRRTNIIMAWNNKTLYSTLATMPAGARVSRFPAMSTLCDKVNMSLALNLLQSIWPTQFKFWPKSWMLPEETPKLLSWLPNDGSQTVIVKPAGGSLGEGGGVAEQDVGLDVRSVARCGGE